MNFIKRSLFLSSLVVLVLAWSAHAATPVGFDLTIGNTPQQQMRYGMDYERLWFWTPGLDNTERDLVARWTTVDADVDFVRVAINPSYELTEGNFNLSAYTTKIIPVMQEMQQANPDIKFFASPRPLHEAYPSGTTVAWQPYPIWITGAPSISSSFFNFNWQKCAEHLVKYLLLMKSYGFEISYLDVTNEWQSNVVGDRLTQDDMEQIENYLNVTYMAAPWPHPALSSTLLLTPADIPEIIAPSSWNYTQGTAWIDSLDAGEKAAISIAASHNTDPGGDAKSFADMVKAELGSTTEIWNTEVHGWRSTQGDNETTSFYHYLEAIRAGFGGINGWLAIGTPNQGHAYILNQNNTPVRNVKQHIFSKLSSTSNRGYALDILNEPSIFNAPLGANDDNIPRNVAAFIKGNLMTVWVVNENTTSVPLVITPAGRTIAETDVRRTHWINPANVVGVETYEPVSSNICFASTIPGESVCCFEIVLDTETFPHLRIEAEDYSHQWGVIPGPTLDIDGVLNLGGLNNGNFTRYEAVALVDNSLLKFRVARPASRPAGQIVIREGSADGNILGQVSIPVTPGWQSYVTIQTTLANDAGIYNLYLEYVSASTPDFFNFNWFSVNNTNNLPPVITLVGGVVNLSAGTPYAEPGYSATDDIDGNITASVVVNNPLPSPTVPGTYIITYDVLDSSGNAAIQVTRTVIVTDPLPPVITLTGGTVALAASATYVDPGYVATDNVDGILTWAVVVNNPIPNPAVPGTYTITYNVSDAAGNMAVQRTRTVVVTDQTPPVITLTGGAVTHAAGTTYVDPGYVASDNVDGILTSVVVVNNPIPNPATLGTYTITYNVSDAAGNMGVQRTRTVVVTDQTPPVITLTGGAVALVPGATYVEPGYTATDNIDGVLTSVVVVNNPVPNPSMPGTYTITYNVSDAAGNMAVQRTRTVVVTDQTPPVITLTGGAVALAAGATYVEPGYVATDNIDGILTSAVVVNNPVPNPSVPGTYTITYDVSDAAGNVAVQKTRTVVVTDQAPPVITLTGGAFALAAGAMYVDPGYAATDNVDGNLTSAVVVNNPIPNPAVLGTYTITYNVSDAAGNMAVQKTRTVVVTDQTPPVITLTGGPVVLAAGATYVDPGYTATDNIDGTLTSAVVVNNPVPSPTVPGTYTITYNVSDAAGNAAVQKTRVVTVSDLGPPVITLTGGPILLAAGAAYVEPGFTALDNVDGNITSLVVVNNPVPSPTVPGTYTITYDVNDSAGNAAVQQTRVVTITDQTAPIITLTGGTVNLPLGAAYVEPGYSATDNEDGNLTSSVVVNSGLPNPLTLGSFTITYDVSDSAGNAAVQATRTVNVTDGNIPVITLVGGNLTIPAGTTYAEPGYSANDNADGNITSLVVVNNPVPNPALPGSYTITYDVTDSSGNAAIQATRVVLVTDQSPPVISLVGGVLNLFAGSTYMEPGYTAIDNIDGDITPAVVVNNPVPSPTIPGTYTLTYNVSDAAGNAAIQVTRTVIVTDNNAPVITLVGGTVSLAAGTPYAEPGYTATDNVDGDLTSAVIVNNPVPSPTAPGTYTITYNVTDSAGNMAVQASRTVIVTDLGAPVITLTAGPVMIAAGTPYVEPGYIATDNVDSNLTPVVVVNNPIPNPTLPGTYTLTYDVSDSAGNAAVQQTRQVTVTDQGLPVITLTGGPVSLPAGAAYVEPGYVATDAVDGDLTSVVVVSNPIPSPTLPGTYTLKYNVSDTAGNPAVPQTRIVTITDQSIPVITLTGGTVNLLLGGTYTEPGFSASDSIDGNLTSAVVVNSNLPSPLALGSFTITYDVSDSAGNVAVQKIRTVNVTDGNIPVITLVGANLTIPAGSVFSDPGYSANDNADGDITSSVIVGNPIPNPAVPGTYTITYDVADSSGNPAITATRVVSVTDQGLPEIALTGGVLSLAAGAPYVEPGFSATDAVDGNLTSAVVINNPIPSPTIPGTYTLTYDVTDAAGNTATQQTRVVMITDQTAPVIILVGGTINLPAGSAYNEPGFSATDNVDGSLTPVVTVVNPLSSPTLPGTYTLTYDVSDAAGNAAAQVTRSVVITDSAPPTIVLTAGTVSLAAGATYAEPGFTASDNVDGDLTSAVIVVNPLPSPTVPGTFTLTYDVSDSAGNAAVQAVRIVVVSDAVAPVITLTGGPIALVAGAPYIEPGYSAFDNIDGIITSNVVVNHSIPSPSVPGTYTITYDVADAAGNMAVQLTREVTITDQTAPIITLIGSTVNLLLGESFTEPGYSATDDIDGNLTFVVVVGGSVPANPSAGTYTLTYDVSDAAGNMAVQQQRTIVVTSTDVTGPSITLSGGTVVTQWLGEVYVEPGYSAVDNVDGDVTPDVLVSNPMPASPPAGSYTITYSVSDSAGNPSTVTRTVVVIEDTTPPAISLVSGTVTLLLGQSYMEPGYAATDNRDGDLSSAVTVSPMLTAMPAIGIYALTYEVTDVAGNVGTNTRLVQVVDGDPDGDGIDSSWELLHGMDPNSPIGSDGGADDNDGDGFDNLDEFFADTDPHDATSYLVIFEIQADGASAIFFPASANRVYTLEYSLDLSGTQVWVPMSGQVNMPGTPDLNGEMMSLDPSGLSPATFYRVRASLP